MDTEDTQTAAQSGWASQTSCPGDVEYQTQLALTEAQNWIQIVTGKDFPHPGDFRRSLESGILLCELLNGLRPDTIRKINRLPTPIAGLDNINVFLSACQRLFGLKDSQLFHSCDLEDLSTRAVADDEEQLKFETDRRLKNVAITIFWLGKVSRKYQFSVPALDLSAFAELVHGSALQSPPPTPSLPPHSPRAPWVPSSPAPSSLCPSPRPGGQSPTVTHDDSYDSISRSSAYGSYHSDDVIAPGNHSDVTPGNHSRSQSSVTSDYDDMSLGYHGDRMPVRHAHTVDGGDGRHGYGRRGLPHAHTVDVPDSRLSADHRSLSQTSLDRTLRENDAAKSRLRGAAPGNAAATNALQFVKVAGTPLAQQAKQTVTVMEKQKETKKVIETTDEDWQSNLSSWKSKMRKKSSGSLQRAQDSEDLSGSMDDPGVKRRSKTFKEMMEGREKRQSGNYSFYPLDNEADDLFSSNQPTTKDDDDKMAAFGFTRVTDDDLGGQTHDLGGQTAATKRRSYMTSHTTETDQSRAGSNGLASKRSASLPHHASLPDHAADSVSTEPVHERPAYHDAGGRINQSQRPNASVDIGSLERITAPKTKGGQRAWAWERRSTSVLEPETPKEPTVASWARDSDDDNNDKENKMADKASESFRGGSETFPRQPVTKIPVVHENSAGFMSARERFESKSTTAPREETVTATRKTYKFTQDTSVNNNSVADSVANNTRSVSDRVSARRTESVTDRVETEARTPAARQLSNTDKKHVEKIIKISQKPNHDKGFGFSIQGGKEYGTPIVVEKVILGGAADVCELLPGDEIVAINGAEVATHYKDSVELVINQAVRLGQIELKIRRSLAKLGLLDREELQLEQEQRDRLAQSQSLSRGSLSSPGSGSVTSPGSSLSSSSLSSPSALSPSVPSSAQSPELSPAPRPAPRPVADTPPSTAPRPANPPPWKQTPVVRKVTAPGVREDPVPALRPAPSSEETAPLSQETGGEFLQRNVEIVVEKTVSSQQAAQPVMSLAPAPLPRVSSRASMDSWTSEDGRLEREVMAQLEQEDLSPQMSFQSYSAPPRPDSPDEDEPPPLPDAPPPLPNWSTFPGDEAPPSGPPAPDQSAVTAADLLPPTATTAETEKVQGRLDNLRRRADFLGRRLEDTEEFIKLKEELALMSGEEESEWQRIEQKEHLSTSSLMDRFDALEARQTPVEIVHERSQSMPQSAMDRDSAEVLATLRKVEQNCEQRQGEIRRQNQLKGWGSTEQVQHSEDDFWGNFRDRTTSDPQEKFDRDQEILSKANEDDLKRAEESEAQKQHEEEKMLEKELSRQRELEEIKRRRDDEREQQRQEDEERTRREEGERRKQRELDLIREAKERAKREEEERKQQDLERRRKEAEQRKKEAELKAREAELSRQREIERQKEAALEKQRAIDREMEYKRREAEREVEVKRTEALRLEREAETRRHEEEQRRQREAELLDEKAEQLRQMEERLHREEEKLQAERERIRSEAQRASYRSDDVTTRYDASPQQSTVEYLYDDRGDSTVQLRRKDPAVIAPRPSIKSEMDVTRRDIMDMNRRPGGTSSRVYEDTYTPSSNSPQMRVKRETNANFRKSWSPDTAASELSFIKKHPDIKPNGDNKPFPMSRGEVLALNRKAFGRKEYASEGHQEEPPPSPTVTPQPMTRKTLHSLGAAPKSRLMSNQQWIREDAPTRRSEVTRRSLTSLSDHWLVEEAERRRIAEQHGTERPSGIPANRQDYPGPYDLYGPDHTDPPHNMDPSAVLAPPSGVDMERLSRSWQGSPAPARPSPTRSLGGPHRPSEGPHRPSPPRSAFSYSHSPAAMSTFRSPGVTHITEVERPEYHHKPARPIPADIKQSLLDRVSHPGASLHSSMSSLHSSHYARPISSHYPEAQPQPAPNHRPASTHYPDPHHPAYRPEVYHPTTGVPQPLGGHYPPIGPGHYGHGPPNHAPPSHAPPNDPSDTSSSASWDRVPPVPPKPPRLMSSSDSEDSFVETVVSLV